MLYNGLHIIWKHDDKMETRVHKISSEQLLYLSIRHDDLVASLLSEIAIAKTESGTVLIGMHY